MAVALAYPDKERAGRGNKLNSLKIKEFEGINSGYISQARTVLRNNPPASHSGIPLSARSSHSMSRIHSLGVFPVLGKTHRHQATLPWGADIAPHRR